MREIDERNQDLEVKTTERQLNATIERNEDLKVKTPERQLNATIITYDSVVQ